MVQLQIFYGLFSAFIAFQLHATYKDPEVERMTAKIKEKMKELPEPDYRLSPAAESYLNSGKLNAYVEDAEQRAREHRWTQEEQQRIDFVKSRPKKYIFDGHEAKFHPEILQDPLSVLDIASSQEEPAHREIILEKCIESGTFERIFSQNLQITLVPQLKKVKQCNGHTSIEEVKDKNQKKLKKKTEKKIDELKQKYSNDPAIKKEFSVSSKYHKHHFCEIISQFHHLDNTDACDHFQLIDSLKRFEEKDEWITDVPEALASIQKNPHCKLAVIQVTEGPAKKQIDGHEIFRDVWKKTLLFECSPNPNSPCANFREQGGVLVKKRCLRENDETGDCELWEKTFDLGKTYVPESQLKSKKEGRRLPWGLNGEFRPAPASNTTDFPQVFTMLKALSEMPLGEGKNLADFHAKMPIFNSKAHRCNRNHVMKELYDCCDSMSGSMPCSEKEKKLRKLRDEGRCHFVGNDLTGILNNRRVKVFCCYPTKLLRIFNENIRKQMGVDWGTAEQPKCGGFSLEDLEGKLEVSLLDVSEAADELGIDINIVENEMVEELRSTLKSSGIHRWYQEESDVVP